MISWTEMFVSRGVIQATVVARMRASRTSSVQTDDRRGAENRGSDAAKLRMKPWKLTSCLSGGFQTSSFSG